MCLLNDTSTRLGSLTACVFIINFIISQIYKRKKLHNCKNHELETIKMHVKEKKNGARRVEIQCQGYIIVQLRETFI